MLHHVELYVSDLERSKAFWTWILAGLGYQLVAEWEEGFTLEVSLGSTYLTFVQAEERFLERGYHRKAVGLNHLAFTVPDRATVDALRAAAQERGATLLYDERYPFAGGGPDYYALYLEDPDRMKVEFVAAT